MKATQAHIDAYPQIIASIVNAANFDSYLELGIGYGVCLRHIAAACLNTRITAVDVKTLPAYNNGIPANRINWRIGVTTDDFFAKNEERFDAIFIDADHSSRQVMIDFGNATRCLNPDGIIFLHDTYPPNVEFTVPNRCSDSFKVYLELSANHQLFEVVNLPTFCGLTIVRPIDSDRKLLTLPRDMQT